MCYQGWSENWAVYYTSPQSCFCLTSFIKFWLVSYLNRVCIYRKGSFVYHHYGWTLIYRAVSNSFRSLCTMYFCDLFQQNYPFLVLKLFDESFDTISIEPNKHKLIKTLGTSVIYSPMSPPFLNCNIQK